MANIMHLKQFSKAYTQYLYDDKHLYGIDVENLNVSYESAFELMDKIFSNVKNTSLLMDKDEAEIKLMQFYRFDYYLNYIKLKNKNLYDFIHNYLKFLSIEDKRHSYEISKNLYEQSKKIILFKNKLDNKLKENSKNKRINKI